MKASDFGPGGKFSFEETYEWFTGGFALVCHTDGKMMGGTVKGLSVMGYDGEEKTYTYFETNTLGVSAPDCQVSAYSPGRELLRGGCNVVVCVNRCAGIARHRRLYRSARSLSE